MISGCSSIYITSTWFWSHLLSLLLLCFMVLYCTVSVQYRRNLYNFLGGFLAHTYHCLLHFSLNVFLCAYSISLEVDQKHSITVWWTAIWFSESIFISSLSFFMLTWFAQFKLRITLTMLFWKTCTTLACGDSYSFQR